MRPNPDVAVFNIIREAYGAVQTILRLIIGKIITCKHRTINSFIISYHGFHRHKTRRRIHIETILGVQVAPGHFMFISVWCFLRYCATEWIDLEWHQRLGVSLAIKRSFSITLCESKSILDNDNNSFT